MAAKWKTFSDKMKYLEILDSEGKNYGIKFRWQTS